MKPDDYDKLKQLVLVEEFKHGVSAEIEFTWTNKRLQTLNQQQC